MTPQVAETATDVEAATVLVEMLKLAVDAPAATAKLEVVFSNPRSYSARLL